jgi:hypothetical protein
MCDSDSVAKVEAEAAGAPDKIAVTPAMVMVGVEAFEWFDPGFSNPEEKVAEIFEKMYAVFRKARYTELLTK